jgi:RND superfamily putative drug exporter
VLNRLARACVHHRRLVVALWVAVLVGLSAAAGTVGGVFEDDFELPGTESHDAVELLTERGFPTQAGAQATLVVHDVGGVVATETRTAFDALLADIAAQVDAVRVSGPFGDGAGHQISTDGTVAYAEIGLADRADDDYDHAVDTITDLTEAARAGGLQVEIGGDRFVEPAEGGGEVLGLIAAVVILFIAFGSLLAMGLPILTALFGIGTGVGVVQLLARVFDMPSFTLQLVGMLGIGVGIDYALFIVTRYREQLAAGLAVTNAVERAIDTAGRAVLFAGATVVISVMGLFVVGLNVNRALAIAAASGVLMTMVASVTLLPAVLGFVGTRIDRFGLPHRRHRATVHRTMWARWSHLIQRRPAFPAAIAFVALLTLAVPVTVMRLGFGDAGNRPTSDTTRRAYDLLADGFGPGFNSPLILAADTPTADATGALDRLVTELAATPGVAAVVPAIPNRDGDAAVVQVIPASAPQDEATTELVHRLRDDTIPAYTAGTGLTVHVGGAQAGVVDYSDYVGQRLPLFMCLVLALSFLLLLAVFRSLLVPIKAVIMNLLSIGAAYGVIVAVFQWGWGAGLLGIGEPGPVEAWAPMMLFAIVFGLSMDYEVFLLSRIKEEYDRTGDNAASVAHGLASTARVITAAAAIMVVVFAGFVLSGDRALQLFGLGLATAVLLDATVVRLVLVPATMALLGDRNWWLPRWLDKALPAIDVEGRHVPAAADPAHAGD